MKTFFQIHVEQPPGDVLIFLPGNMVPLFHIISAHVLIGQDEIENLQQSIRIYANDLSPDKMQVHL